MWDGQYAFEKSKIIQGDCLEKMKLIPDGSVDLILADLPYGTTACKWDSIIDLPKLWSEYERVIKDNGAIVLTAAEPFTSALVMSNPKMFKHEWIWMKNASTCFQAAKYRPLQKHESVLVFGKRKVTYNPQKTKGHKPTNSAKSCRQAGIYQGDGKWEYKGGGTDRYPTTIQEFKIERGLHPTQKPVALFEYLIKTYTNEGAVVLDNVAGSGTTGEACINLNRDFILIEKEPNYYEVIKERVEKIFKNYGLDLHPFLI